MLIFSRWATVEVDGGLAHGGPTGGEAHVTLPGVPSSVRLARQAVASFAAAHGSDEECVDAARLLVSETVTNALVHAGPSEISLELVRLPGRLRIAVSDGTVAPLSRRNVGNDEEGGRGLALLDALATRWGCETDPGGKTVWFELAC